jgi:hypothetical protein
MQLILSNIERRDNCLKRFAEACKGTLTDKWDGKSIPVVVGNLHGADNIQMDCRKRGHPYILIDHGYFNRDFGLSVARFCVGNYHNTDWRETNKPIPKVRDWRKGRHVLIIPPAEKIAYIYGAENWVNETIKEVKKYTDRPIIVKKKNEGKLGEYLAMAHVTVSFGSVADVESAIFGVPVITSRYSPAIPISNKIEDIEDLKEFDRTSWLKALAGAEWKADEMQQCWQRLKEQLRIDYGIS